MNPATNEYFKGIMDYLRDVPPSRSPDEVIADCAAKGFSPMQISVGLTFARGVPWGETKGMVMRHPVWGSRRDDWRKFHDDLAEMMEKEE